MKYQNDNLLQTWKDQKAIAKTYFVDEKPLSLRGKTSNAKHVNSLTHIAILSIGISGVEKVILERESQLLIWELERRPKVFMAVVIVRSMTPIKSQESTGKHSRMDYSNY